MFQKLCYYLFFKRLGWKEQVSVPNRNKCIICVAPHTSNWDFFLGELYYTAKGKKAGFLMKNSWFFWPLGSFLRYIGGIPVERKKHTSLTDAVAEKARQSEYFHLAVTPEGTRSRVEIWKRGFYFIALKANIPIQLYAIDYEQRRIVCTREIFPKEENVEKDMKEIMDYYSGFKGRHPENFQVEDIQ